MVDTLYAKTRLQNNPKEKVLVCLDVGIATEDNLQKIREKGYKYLCVSRRRLADYEYASDAKTIIREFGIRNAKINRVNVQKKVRSKFANHLIISNFMVNLKTNY